jgi:hypothetical protein
MLSPVVPLSRLPRRDTTPAAVLEVRHPELRRLLPGLPRGAITEVTGARSSGRTALVHSLLATATQGGEVVAVIDPRNAFDPATAQAAGTDLDRLLWVQCNGRLDQALKATDLVLHSGGFRLIVLDLCDFSARELQRIPLSYWYRFRNAVERTPGVLLVAGNQPTARACAACQLEVRPKRVLWRGVAPFQFLEGFEIEAALRKPMRAETAAMRAPAG